MMSVDDDARGTVSGIIKIIGLGQSMRGDDAAGLAVVQLWGEMYSGENRPPNVEAIRSELPGLGLLDLLEGARLAILVDAVRSGAAPGTIHVLSSDQLESFTAETSSAHGWGVAETLALGQVLAPSSMPQKIVLIGIEAGDVSIGETLSPEVIAAIPQAAQAVQQLITRS
jgi:hydrogenase maturation protease